MSISLPPITSRRFPLYWGLISFVSLVPFTILFQVIPSGNSFSPAMFFLHPFCLHAAPLILLQPRLKWKQKIIWISSQWISQLVLILAAVCIFGLNFKLDPPTYVPETVYNSRTYSITAIAIIIWVIASFVQLRIISFKHPKRWLICNILTFGVQLISLCWSYESTRSEASPSEASLLENAIGIFLYGFLMPGFTGLGLYFSGMGIRRQRNDRSLE